MCDFVADEEGVQTRAVLQMASRNQYVRIAHGQSLRRLRITEYIHVCCHDIQHRCQQHALETSCEPEGLMQYPLLVQKTLLIQGTY